MKTFFGMISKRPSRVFLQTMGAIFWNQTTLVAFSAWFSENLPIFSGILPGFSTNQDFWGWACTPASYTTPLPSITTNLWYCDKTRRSDIVTEQERSNASSTRHRPSHAIRKSKSLHTVVFQVRRRYYSQNLVRTTLSPRLWESDCDANNCCWGHVKIYKLLTAADCGPLRLYETSSMATSIR